MKRLVTATSTLAALLLAFSAHAGPRWFETEHFKSKFPDWAAKFVATHAKLTAAQQAYKKAREAVIGEKSRHKHPELAKALNAAKKELWDNEILWLKLHQEWKKFDLERHNKLWDERIAKINEAIASGKSARKELLEARHKLFEAEKAWIQANRDWRRMEADWHFKHWADRIQKLTEQLSKLK